MKRNLILGLLLIIPLFVTLYGCGKSSAGDTSISVKVGSISTAVSARTAAPRASVVTDAAKSTTEYAFAKVDGIKLSLTRLQATNGSNESDIVSWSGGKEVIIAPGTNNTLPITETASINSGTYTGLKVRYKNSYSVKAFCRTATKLVYTTAAGIVIDVDPGTATALPFAYDFYSYPFAEVTTASSAAGPNNETMAQTDGSYTITKGSSPSMAVLFDPSYLVSCFDGTVSNASNSNALAPFPWSNNNGQTTASFFPNTAPNFGMGYVPIFVWLSTTAGEALPTAETYASSTTVSLVGALNFKSVNITSLAFRADGTVLDARARISSGGSSGELQQFFSDFVKSRATYAMKNGEWTCDTGYTNCHAIQDKAITGFARTSDLTSISTSTYGDGPDCGKSCIFPEHTEWGNRCRACATSTTMSWRQLPR